MAGNLLLSLVHARVVKRGKRFEVERVQARELAVVIQLLGNAEERLDEHRVEMPPAAPRDLLERASGAMAPCTGAGAERVEDVGDRADRAASGISSPSRPFG